MKRDEFRHSHEGWSIAASANAVVKPWINCLLRIGKKAALSGIYRTSFLLGWHVRDKRQIRRLSHPQKSVMLLKREVVHFQRRDNAINYWWFLMRCVFSRDFCDSKRYQRFIKAFFAFRIVLHEGCNSRLSMIMAAWGIPLQRCRVFSKAMENGIVGEKLKWNWWVCFMKSSSNTATPSLRSVFTHQNATRDCGWSVFCDSKLLRGLCNTSILMPHKPSYIAWVRSGSHLLVSKNPPHN